MEAVEVRKRRIDIRCPGKYLVDGGPNPNYPGTRALLFGEGWDLPENLARVLSSDRFPNVKFHILGRNKVEARHPWIPLALDPFHGFMETATTNAQGQVLAHEIYELELSQFHDEEGYPISKLRVADVGCAKPNECYAQPPQPSLTFDRSSNRWGVLEVVITSFPNLVFGSAGRCYQGIVNWQDKDPLNLKNSGHGFLFTPLIEILNTHLSCEHTAKVFRVVGED